MQQPQQTATGTSRHALQLPSDGPDETRVDLIFQDTKRPHVSARIKCLIRRERHFDVYSVDSLTGHAEARAFITNDVPQKVKRHRKRCMSRLGHKVWLEASCRGAMVVVYWANKPGEEGGSSDKVAESSKSKKERVKKKTDYDREATRIRQLEKRRKNRKCKAAMKASRDASIAEDTKSINDNVPGGAAEISDDDIYFWAAILLCNEYNEKGRPRENNAELSWDRFFLHDEMMGSIKFNEFYRLLSIYKLWTFWKGWMGHLKKGIQRATDDLAQLEAFLEQMLEQVSKMPYRQLSSGIHGKLSQISSQRILHLTSKNPRLAILRHIKSVLPALLENVKAVETRSRRCLKKTYIHE